MNGTTTSFVPEMLNCVDASMTVLERERVRFKWQQQVQQEEEMIGYYSNLEEMGGCGCGLLGEVVTRSGFMGGSGWPDLVGCFGSSNTDNICGSNNNNNNNKMDNELNCGIARTCNCPPLVPAAKRGVVVPAGVQDKMAFGVGVARASSKKRKADKVVAEEESMDKVSKGFREDGESKTIDKSSNTKSRNGNNNHNNNNNKENSAETSKDNNSKVTEILKQDYIHVRARRGQATDSHSLAERVRREKISERMRYLQDLVPGCNKITGKAGMLDEIINYVQSLQRQVEFLSMKLAAVNPRVDFNIHNLFAKEAFPGCSTNFPIFGISTDMANSAYVQLNPIQEPMVTFSGLDIGINHPDTGLRRTISAAVSIPEPFIESSCFSQMKQIQPLSTWDADVQNLCNVAFDQGRSASFPSQPFTGPIEAGNLKMEM